MTDAPGFAPLRDPVEESLPFGLSQHLRIPNAVHPPTLWNNGNANGQRPGPRAPADLVDARDDRMAALPEFPLDDETGWFGSEGTADRRA